MDERYTSNKKYNNSNEFSADKPANNSNSAFDTSEKFDLVFNKAKKPVPNANYYNKSNAQKDVFSNDKDVASFTPANQNFTQNSNSAFVGSNNASNPTSQADIDFNKQMQMQLAQKLAKKNSDFSAAQSSQPSQMRATTSNRVPNGSARVPNSTSRSPVSDSRVPTGAQRVPTSNQRVPNQVNINPQAGNPNAQLPPVMPTFDSNNGGTNKTKKKKGAVKRFFAVVISLVLILAISAGAFGYSILGNLSYDSTFIESNEYIDSSLLFSSDDIINILFLGSDAREDLGSSRSDTMMLCSIDTVNKEIKLTSFLRDSYVYIPSIGYSTKLNAAFAYGGAQLVIDTIEYNFKVDIDQYVMVDFETFELLIDLLGGITVDDVTEKEATYMNDVVKISNPLEEGTNIMDGSTALWYCRIRYLDSDFYRTQRQRKVIESIIDEITQTNIFDLIDIVEEVLPNISTNITQDEFVTLAFSALVYMNYDISQMQIPVDGTWYNDTISSQAVLVMDIDENAELLQEFLTSDTVTRDSDTEEDD